MNRILLAIFLAGTTLAPSTAATLSRSYSYFNVRGTSLADIERQLDKHGPQIDETAERHPGATNMEFTSRIRYREANGYCTIDQADISIDAKVTLPRWRDRRRADKEMRLIWDTLASDIKRHEESHLSIAKSHARMLEDALLALPRQRSCEKLEQQVERETDRVLASHDAEQNHFDKVESINFESRMQRLLDYRLDLIESGQLKY